MADKPVVRWFEIYCSYTYLLMLCGRCFYKWNQGKRKQHYGKPALYQRNSSFPITDMAVVFSTFFSFFYFSFFIVSHNKITVTYFPFHKQKPKMKLNSKISIFKASVRNPPSIKCLHENDFLFFTTNLDYGNYMLSVNMWIVLGSL